MAELKKNIYAESVARSVFIWIALIFLVIGLVWDAIIKKRLSTKVGEIMNVGQDVLITGVGFIPGYGTAISIGATILKWLGQNGGKAMTIISLFFLFIYESCWRPWDDLKDATIHVPEVTQAKSKQK